MLVEFEKKILIGGIFFNIGGNGANMLVEFEKKILMGAFFSKIGHISPIAPNEKKMPPIKFFFFQCDWLPKSFKM